MIYVILFFVVKYAMVDDYVALCILSIIVSVFYRPYVHVKYWFDLVVSYVLAVAYIEYLGRQMLDKSQEVQKYSTDLLSPIKRLHNWV